jgi:hypothetical protein
MSVADPFHEDDFAAAAEAIRYYREFESDEDAIWDWLTDRFFATFNEIERWAADNDCGITHRRAWRIHDAFCEAPTLAAERAAYERLLWLGRGRRIPSPTMQDD